MQSDVFLDARLKTESHTRTNIMHLLQEATVLVYPMLPEFRQKVLLLRPFVLLVRAICECKRVWSIGLMTLTGEKVQESRNRPRVAQRVPGDLGSQISWHSAHEVGEVVSLTHRPLYPQEMFLVLIFTRAESTPGPLDGRKEYVTEKSSDTTGNRSRDRLTSNAAP